MGRCVVGRAELWADRRAKQRAAKKAGDAKRPPTTESDEFIASVHVIRARLSTTSARHSELMDAVAVLVDVPVQIKDAMGLGEEPDDSSWLTINRLNRETQKTELRGEVHGLRHAGGSEWGCPACLLGSLGSGACLPHSRWNADKYFACVRSCLRCCCPSRFCLRQRLQPPPWASAAVSRTPTRTCRHPPDA